ncbi:endonuclease/exonuclease/phosphatase family protein [Glaciecola sp. MF2-115]|uniref:endonuclease/exonuclease/phosphatase family protein n=1 Tax=Glaciecola sp. MF2-115 TaxID=3384827 RepID=UPI0039A3121D
MKHSGVDKPTAQGLLALKQRIADHKIVPSIKDKTINLATWNIREFGRKTRLDSSIHFIAEILSQFDLIAITELRKNLDDLKRVMKVLGPYWDVIYSDYVADWGGNWERIAYVYDKRNVRFTGLAAEADSPRKKNKRTGEYETEFDWWRKPYIASFKSGNFDFVLISAHIRWGKSGRARVKPLKLLAEWVEKRRSDVHTDDTDLIVMGDFNIPRVGDSLYKAITSKGMKAPEALLGLKHGSNLAKNKRYDQILHHPSYTNCFTNHAGVLDFYANDIASLFPEQNMSKRAFTYQLSDHLPLWIQIAVDTEKEELEAIVLNDTDN